jgi:hypothetical protein
MVTIYPTSGEDESVTETIVAGDEVVQSADGEHLPPRAVHDAGAPDDRVAETAFCP